MLDTVRGLFRRYAISKALTKPTPDKIYFGGAKGRGNDFYQAIVYDPAKKLDLNVTSLTADGVKGMNYIEPKENDPPDTPVRVAREITTNELGRARIYYRSWYREYSRDRGWTLNFIFAYYFKLDALYARRQERIQEKFNRRAIAERDRMEVLQYFKEKTIQDRTFASTNTQILEDLNTVRAFGHPNRDSMLNYYHLILESLKEKDCLESDKSSYKLKPNGLNVLSDYENERRQFQKDMGIQNGIRILTFVLASLAAIQTAASVWQAYIDYSSAKVNEAKTLHADAPARANPP